MTEEPIFFFGDLIFNKSKTNPQIPEIIRWILTCIQVETKNLFNFEISPDPNQPYCYINRFFNEYKISAAISIQDIRKADNDSFFRLYIANFITKQLNIKLNDYNAFEEMVSGYKNLNYPLYCLFLKK